MRDAYRPSGAWLPLDQLLNYTSECVPARLESGRNAPGRALARRSGMEILSHVAENFPGLRVLAIDDQALGAWLQ